MSPDCRTRSQPREPPGLAPKLEKVGVAVELRLCRPFIGHPKFYFQHCKLGGSGLLGETHRQTHTHIQDLFLTTTPHLFLSFSPTSQVIEDVCGFLQRVAPLLGGLLGQCFGCIGPCQQLVGSLHSRGTSVRGGPIPPHAAPKDSGPPLPT